MVTAPVDASTVATRGSLLLQAPVPPPNTTPLAVYVAGPPIHSGLVPVTDVMATLALVINAPETALVTSVPQVPETMQ